MEFFEKTLSRLLPIPPEIISKNMTKDEVRVEAEMWCKPFACAIQGCSEPRVRNEEEKQRCANAPYFYKLCVDRVQEHIQEIIKGKI